MARRVLGAEAGFLETLDVGLGRAVNARQLGAGACIDRGKFAATEVGDGTKIDNLVQVGHNCRIGRSVVIAGCAALGGSVIVGDGAMIGGGANIRDHVRIGAGAKIYAFAGVMSDVPAEAVWGGYTAQDAKMAARQYAALRKLPDLMRSMRRRDHARGRADDSSDDQR